MSDSAICPQVLAGALCTERFCTFAHNPPSCDLCNLIFPTAPQYTEHVATKQHQNRLCGEFGSMLYCSGCDKHISGTKNWAVHVRGAQHLQKAGGRHLEAEESGEMPGHTLCTTCNSQIPDKSWPRHHLMPKHLAKTQFLSFRTALDEAEKDKNGVSVSGAFDFGIVEPSLAGAGVRVNASITNTTPYSIVSIVNASFASSKGVRMSTPFTLDLATAHRSISYKQTLNFTVSMCQSHNGRAQDRLELEFEDRQLGRRFVIMRTLAVIVGDRDDHENLRPSAPYVPRKRTARQPETNVVEGVAPPSLRVIRYVVVLPESPIPKALSAALATGTASSIVQNMRTVFLPPVLNSATYPRHFKHLIWIEEHRMERDLQYYDITEAKLTVHHPYHYVSVPGLAEKRPSVLVGDRILVQQTGAAAGHWFEGGVHVVRKEEVGLWFHSSFGKASPLARFTVRFKLNRHPVRRQHLALDTAFDEDRVLFPKQTHMPAGPVPTNRIQVKNPLIARNPPQLQAVVSIVERAPGSVPFVIFGPPGTGKTVTMVESIFQILSADPQARVLAIAPSNSAADLIATRLMSLGTDQLFRFYAPSRHKETVPLELRAFTFATANGHFAVPALAKMKTYRVVVTTCVSASVVSGIGIPRGHYSHIFCDEAGQATEPEVTIAIKTMADKQTNVVLSGDPKQLGPIIRSAIARELGLEKSFIERLMALEIYDQVKGYGKSVVKLTKNFRSHPSILKFPNERFYQGELEACGSPSVINAYVNWGPLSNGRFPVIFHAIRGKDDREASSPSFFNVDEVSQVKSYVGMLRDDRRVRITDNDIGVITPYHAQCLKIRAVLRAFADGVKVGSVEEFQGQERQVIIVSTVRSSREFVEYDLRHTLGFVANPRRFNVAVTRAQALLIVIGDPDVLGLDPLWRTFLNYVHGNGGWIGPDISWNPDQPVDEAGGYDQAVREAALFDMTQFTKRMEDMTVAGVNADDADEDVDRPWQDVE